MFALLISKFTKKNVSNTYLGKVTKIAQTIKKKVGGVRVKYKKMAFERSQRHGIASLKFRSAEKYGQQIIP